MAGKKKFSGEFAEHILERLTGGPIGRDDLLPESDLRPKVITSLDELVKKGLVRKAFSVDAGGASYYLSSQEADLITSGRLNQKDIIPLSHLEGPDLPKPHKGKGRERY